MKNINLFLCTLPLLFFACQNQEGSDTDVDYSPPDTIITDLPTDTTAVPREIGIPDWPLTPERARGKLYPFDEASRNPDFVAFRQRLYEAVRNKDLNFLKGIVAKDVKVSFGVENGYEEFLRMWNLNNTPQNSAFWQEMQTILELGGGFQGDSLTFFMAPYLHLVEVEDPFQIGAIVGEGVRLRAEPNTNSTVLATLSYDQIEFLPQQNPKRETIDGQTDIWEKVKTVDGKEGFVFGKFARSPVDFRVGFQNISGQWKMTFFVAGD